MDNNKGPIPKSEEHHQLKSEKTGNGIISIALNVKCFSSFLAVRNG